MRRNVLMLVATASLGCGSSSGLHQYQSNDLQLVTGYAAKEYCSCLFVMEQTDAFCNAWTRANPQVATIRLDRAAKRVEASAGLMWGARARFVDARFGC